MRSWRCLNKRCGKHFDSGEPFPACPACRTVKVEWLPRALNIAKVAPSAARLLRSQTAALGLSNIKSAHRDEGVKITRNGPEPGADGPVRGPPGFQYRTPTDGNPHASWSKNPPASRLSGPVTVGRFPRKPGQAIPTGSVVVARDDRRLPA